jgi:hypothetical protein
MEMVLKPLPCLALTGCAMLHLSCDQPPKAPNMELAKYALMEYCKAEVVSPADFYVPHVYKENNYDWCVEFVTKTNSPQNHVLLLYFKGDRIVERQRIIEVGEAEAPRRRKHVPAGKTKDEIK